MTGALTGGRRATGAPRRLSTWVLVVAAAQFAVLLVTSSGYGYHRDELYFIAAGSHPAFGYPDQPPLVPLLCWAMNQLAPGSLLLLRLPSGLAAAATTILAGLISRDLGGGRRAQLIAASCTAVSAFVLVTGHFVTTTTFDLLGTTAVCWVMIRGLSGHGSRWLLIAGLLVGVGCQAKSQIAVVALMMLLAISVTGPRWPWRSPWLAAAAVAAVAGAAPYLIWQGLHGWPQLTVAANIGGSAEGGRAGFLPFQLVMVSPLLVPVWIAGLIAPFRQPALAAVRFVPLGYGLLALAYLVGDGKAYYLASMYPALLGIGALPVAGWTLRRPSAVRTATFSAAVAVSAAISALIALPLLPAASLAGSITLAINPDQGETVGWPEFVGTIDRAWAAIPAATRRETVIFTRNYGEAGAIDLLGRPLGLPRAYSGHNGFSSWGPPRTKVGPVLLVGFDGPGDAAPAFADCSSLATVDNGVGLDNQEQHLPLLLCRPTRSWSELWPELVHYN